MSKWIIALAVVGAFVFASFTNAAEKEKKAPGLRGKVTSVKTEGGTTEIVLSVKHGKDAPAEDKTIKADSSVKVTKGDDAATIADVVVGSYISVTQEGDKVTAIKIMQPKKK